MAQDAAVKSPIGKLLIRAWLWIAVAWMATLLVYLALMVIASGEKHRYFDAGLGHIVEIHTGRGGKYTAYVTQTQASIYGAVENLFGLEFAITLLGVVVLAARGWWMKRRVT